MWKIYYSDGSTFSDQDGTPWRAPGLDVQVIVLEDEQNGWMIQAHDDYYIWDDRGDGARWWGVDRAALDEYLFYYPGHKCALMGRRISSKEFDKIYERASNDPDFPKKTAFAYGEPQP
ncbi:MAG: hypothetical protein ACXAEN_27310 [Candidatus Thorarchaeota archaeon]|jgi:hypothetical protein